MTGTVAAAIDRGRAQLAAAGIETAGLEARVLYEHVAGCDSAAALARGRDPIEPSAAARFCRLLCERARRVPLAYVTGEREFWSLRLRVDCRVLVPRPETETLVEVALERLDHGTRVADVGTGSGAIAIALAHELGSGVFLGIDRCPEALALARENAAAHGLSRSIEFIQGDLLAPLYERRTLLDAIVSNPPYVPSEDLNDLQPEVRDHEPRLALDGGPDGLDALARIVSGAPSLLRRGGWLLLEIGAGQAGAVRTLMERSGDYDDVTIRRDLAGIERVVAARRAA